MQDDYEQICDEVRSIDLTSEFPVKVRDIEEIFRTIIQTQTSLREIFDCFNKNALEDSEFAAKLSYVLNSKQFQHLEIDNLSIRNVLLNILQLNFEKASTYKQENLEKYYNSISLLGECYQRIKLVNGAPVAILGKSLINILTNELSSMMEEKIEINEDFANLILNQIVLNGRLAKIKHKDEIERLMLTIRKCLIETDNLSSQSKAFLTMTLDLYYNNFMNVGKELEEYYGKYLKAFEEKTEAKRKANQKKLPLDGSLRERLKLSKSGDVRFERPSLQIDKKVEELVTQKPADSIDLYRPESPLEDQYPPESSKAKTSPKHKKDFPKKVQPPRKLKESPEKPEKTVSTKTPTSKKETKSPVKNSQSPGKSKDLKPPGKSSSNKSESSPPNEHVKENGKVTETPDSDKNKNIKICSVPDPKAVTEIVELENCNEARIGIGESCSSSSLNSTSTEDSSNILRQQNSCQIIENSTKPEKEKEKSNVKVYFREENVENLTWEHQNEDDTPETPPKLNPYSRSFLSFLENQ